MSMFNKGMKIGEGQKFDVTQVSTEGLTPEEIEQMDKKARKLIDIYNTDGKAGLSQIELARAMDAFSVVDGGDGKLSNKELDNYAKWLNEKQNLTGDNALSGKDLKAFLKAVQKHTKGDEKASTKVTIEDDAIADYVKENGLTAVEGHTDVYQKDGKYTMITRGDRLRPARAVLEDGEFRRMTLEELRAEGVQERQAAIDKKAEEGGLELWDEESGVYTKEAADSSRLDFIYDDKKGDFVRSIYDYDDNDNLIVRAMTQEEVEAADAKIQQNVQREQEAAARKKELETPKAYTVQNGESLTSILKRSLAAQGKEVNAKNLAEAKAEFIKNNPKALQGPKGREYLYAGDVVKVAGNLEDKANGDEIRTSELNRQARVRQQREEQARAEAAKAEEAKAAEAAKAAKAAKEPQPIKLNGSDPNTGKLDNKDFVPVKGRGMCKYNPSLKGYELYSGTYDGKYYENGVAKSLATTQLVKYDVETGLKKANDCPDDYYRNYKTYHYKNGSLTPLHRDPTYNSNVQIKIGGKTYELANGPTSGYAHTDFKDFVKKFLDPNTGVIRAKDYVVNTYYLKLGDTQYPVKIDKQTRALIVDVNGRKIDMNDLMTGKATI